MTKRASDNSTVAVTKFNQLPDIALLLRPDEVLSGILDAPVLEVAHDALRVLLQHRHMGAGCVA